MPICEAYETGSSSGIRWGSSIPRSNVTSPQVDKLDQLPRVLEGFEAKYAVLNLNSIEVLKVLMAAINPSLPLGG